MSIKCVAERYDAYRITLRISVDIDSLADIKECANLLAMRAEKQLGTSGSTISYGDGRWKGDVENGAVIEIVTREQPTNADMERISYSANVGVGLSCFATVDHTVAFELYELAE